VHSDTHTHAVEMTVGLGLIFVIFASLSNNRASFLVLGLVFFCIVVVFFVAMSLVVITSANDCLESLVSEMTLFVDWNINAAQCSLIHVTSGQDVAWTCSIQGRSWIFVARVVQVSVGLGNGSPQLHSGAEWVKPSEAKFKL